MGSRRTISKRKFGHAKGWHQLRRKKHTAIRTHRHGQLYSVQSISENGMKLVLKPVANRNILESVHNNYMITKSICTDKELKLCLRSVKQPSLSGYRLFHSSKLQHHINTIVQHSVTCIPAQQLIVNGKESFKIHSDAKHIGLATILLGECLGCSSKFYLDSSYKIQTVGKQQRYDVNVRSVWGTMVTGRGNSSINELCGTLDMPGMSRHTFTSIESEIGQLWEKTLFEDLLAAGVEERKLAVSQGRYHQGVPSITVVCDGGWSKRSHRHTYNAMGGVAIIIGAATGKLLYIGVRNKYCPVCSRAFNLKKDPPTHNCFQNWKESSQAMESDIILNGFLQAESMHGVRYMEMIGDGDSSVYSRISEEVPIWGSSVTKIECSNHICKCLRTHLEHLVEDNKQYKGRHNLTKPLRGKLVATVRSAITYRHKQILADPTKDRVHMQRLLQHDIRNALIHLSGDHSQCSDFCLVQRTQGTDENIPIATICDLTHPPSTECSTHSSTSQMTGSEDETDNIDTVLNDQISYWNSINDNSSKSETASFQPSVELQKDVYILLDKVASKAHRLLTNSTTNLAESWMFVRMKFDGGKVFNRCSRGSWHYRCYGGALRKKFGAAWAPIVWESVTGTPAGDNFHHLCESRSRHHDISLKNQRKPVAKSRRIKRKLSSAKESSTQIAKHSYGPQAVDVVADVSPDHLQRIMDSYYSKEILISDAQNHHITEQTKSQSLCGYWMEERRKRLTASNFADVVKRSPAIPVKLLVQRLVYTKFTGNRLTRKGLKLEKYAIEEYKIFKATHHENVTVKSAGLFISMEHPFLAASPDGLVESDVSGTGLVEVKHVLLNKTCSFEEAASSNSSFCLHVENGNLCLKPNHKFTYQIQGQLNVLNLAWLDLVVRRVDPHQLHVQRFYRDSDFWKHTMLPKLQAFYMKAVLPELAEPRYGKSPGIREPGKWFSSARPVQKQRRSPAATCTHSSPPPPPPSAAASSAPSTPPHIQTFLGRYISHEWLDDFGRSEWYPGSVIHVLDGIDGHTSAVYEILYDGCDEAYEVDHLIEDYEANSVVFLDL